MKKKLEEQKKYYKIKTEIFFQNFKQIEAKREGRAISCFPDFQFHSILSSLSIILPYLLVVAIAKCQQARQNLINFEDFLKPRKFVSQRHKLLLKI